VRGTQEERAEYEPFDESPVRFRGFITGFPLGYDHLDGRLRTKPSGFVTSSGSWLS
jgi:hypothetical protein